MTKIAKNRRRPTSWKEFFRFRDKAIAADPQAFEEFLAERKDEAPEQRGVKTLGTRRTK